MRRIRIKVAGIAIELNTEFYPSYKICKDFYTDEAPVFSVQCTPEDYEREEFEFKKKYNSLAPSDVYLEVNALLRKVADRVIDYSGFLIHGAAIAIDNKAFLFSAPSGTGKTTHVKLWLDKCPRAYVINGDKPIVRLIHDQKSPIICGSPWAGKENMYSNSMVPLKAIIFLERSDENAIEEITFKDAFPDLYRQIYHPTEKRRMVKTIQLLKSLEAAISFYHFKINNYKDDCFEIVYKALMNSDKI